jgi:hypothetical protein
MSVWPLQEVAKKAPVLVVGRVLSVEKAGRNAEASRKAQADIFDMTAGIEVLRSFTHAGETIAANRIRVGYLGVTPNGSLSQWPILEPGQVLVFPLQENTNPTTVVWRMIAESGEGLILPTAAVLPEEGPLPTTAMQFLLREIANALSRGTPGEMAEMGRFVAMPISAPGDNHASELMRLLEPIIGSDRQGWAKVATNVLAGRGTPRPTVSNLFSDQPLLSDKQQPYDWHAEQGMLLAQAALRKLGQGPATDALLIKTWIADAPWQAWGSANALVEYAKNPVTTETLRQALRDDVPGALTIAFWVLREGNREVLPEALARAFKVADRPGGNNGEVQDAGGILRDYGSDPDLDRLAALVRKYQSANRDFYMSLWQSAASPRVLGVVLSDRSVVPNSSTAGFRVCDYALETLERAVGQKFGTGDEAIARAQAWLKSQGITN